MCRDHRTPLPFELSSGSVPLVEATFVPRRYEPNYAYPLLVLLHSRGGDEQQLVRAMPTVSWRNYVGLGLRGPEPILRDGQEVGHDWGAGFQHPRRRNGADAHASLSDLEIVQRVIQNGNADEIDTLDDSIFASVRKTRRALHVHSERIFLVGHGEGAAVAYRLGLTYPERFAGVVAINGWLPRSFPLLRRWRACQDLRVLVVHGQWNARAPIDEARRDVTLLRNAGLNVAFQSYPCAHRLTSSMLSDVDTWLINQCTAELL